MNVYMICTVTFHLHNISSPVALVTPNLHTYLDAPAFAYSRESPCCTTIADIGRAPPQDCNRYGSDHAGAQNATQFDTW